MTTWYILCT